MVVHVESGSRVLEDDEELESDLDRVSLEDERESSIAPKEETETGNI